MPIDPMGTAPGLTAKPDEPKILNLRCRNASCDCMQAIEVTPPGMPGVHRYQCVKCKNTWGVNVGGTFNLY
jgi:transposase-like protein